MEAFCKYTTPNYCMHSTDVINKASIILGLCLINGINCRYNGNIPDRIFKRDGTTFDQFDLATRSEAKVRLGTCGVGLGDFGHNLDTGNINR